jgi:hypothetical protein
MDSVLCGVGIGGTKLGLGIVSTKGRFFVEETIHGLNHRGASCLDGIRRKVKELARGMICHELPVLPATLSACGIAGAASLLLSV